MTALRPLYWNRQVGPLRMRHSLTAPTGIDSASVPSQLVCCVALLLFLWLINSLQYGCRWVENTFSNSKYPFIILSKLRYSTNILYEIFNLNTVFNLNAYGRMYVWDFSRNKVISYIKKTIIFTFVRYIYKILP